MKRTTIATLLAAAFAVAQANAQVTITLWDFNGESTTTVPGGTLSPTPAVGAGTASLLAGNTATFASGAVNGGSSDPAGGAPPNYAWNTTTYAAQGTDNLMRGAQFNVSTVGYSDIQLSYDLRHSNTSSRYERVQYSLDGINFVDSLVFDGNAGDTWFNSRVVDLSAISGANNNPNFAFRVVAEWESTATGAGTDAYAPSNPVSNYAPAGTWRFDMVQVTSIPEPTSAALLGLGAAALLIFRRRH